MPKRQAEFFFGRLAARLALPALAGNRTPADHDMLVGDAPFARVNRAIDTFDIAIGPSREPLWPDGVIGSISHSHRFAAAAVDLRGHRQGVGIDIEHVVSDEAREALLGTVVSEEEVAYLHAFAPAWPLDVLLTLVFSAKESLFKGAFGAVGRYFDFSAARLVALDPVRGHLRFTLTQTLCPQFVRAQQCELGFSFLRADTVITHFVW